MIFEDSAVEQLKQGEADCQKTIESYTNIDLKSQAAAFAADSKVSTTAKALRQNEEDGLKTGDVTEDDHGKKFSSDDDDEFFKPPAQQRAKVAAMMEAQREILHDAEAYDDYVHYSSQTATMEADETYKEPAFSYEEASYSDDWSDCTYDVCTLY
ncbi:hypothetical protein ACHAXT_004561 [Thalassiosira profunda]